MNYLVLDLETANSDCASICQIGIVRVENGEVADTVAHLIDPRDRFDHWNIKVHGIEPDHVAGCPTFPDILPQLAPLLDNNIIVTHGSFDRVAIHKACQKHGLPSVTASWLDNQTVVRRTWPQFAKRGYSLGNLARHFGIEFRHHDALEDAVATAHIFRRALSDSGRTASDWVTAVTGHSASRSRILHEGVAGAPFSGKTLVFTGRMQVPREEAGRLAAAQGFTVTAALSPETNVLCVGGAGASRGKSSKERDAEKLVEAGRPLAIVGEDAFWQMLAR